MEVMCSYECVSFSLMAERRGREEKYKEYLSLSACLFIISSVNTIFAKAKNIKFIKCCCVVFHFSVSKASRRSLKSKTRGKGSFCHVKTKKFFWMLKCHYVRTNTHFSILIPSDVEVEKRIKAMATLCVIISLDRRIFVTFHPPKQHFSQQVSFLNLSISRKCSQPFCLFPLIYRLVDSNSIH